LLTSLLFHAAYVVLLTSKIKPLVLRSKANPSSKKRKKNLIVPKRTFQSVPTRTALFSLIASFFYLFFPVCICYAIPFTLCYTPFLSSFTSKKKKDASSPPPRRSVLARVLDSKAVLTRIFAKMYVSQKWLVVMEEYTKNNWCQLIVVSVNLTRFIDGAGAQRPSMGHTTQ
jgi:hypothetical protein